MELETLNRHHFELGIKDTYKHPIFAVYAQIGPYKLEIV
jgi:hypothetical protein